MKLMHLSDLHIGKRVNEFSMMEDQNYILEQILEILDHEQADGVLLAGDIYDKPVPPVEAVQAFDRFLTRIAKRGIPVFLISGNHDSAERLSFAAGLLGEQDVHIAGGFDGCVKQIVLRDSYGEVGIYLLPFVKPVTVRHALARQTLENSKDTAYGEDEKLQADAGRCENTEPQAAEQEKKSSKPEREIVTYQDAVKAALDTIAPAPDRRNVLVAHQFVTGAGRCESEEIVVGGLDQVDVSLFDAFDYVALGHLHSPQSVGRETVRYCGTPLKYSFSEAGQEKSVTIVELKEKGVTQVWTVPLHPLRDMRKIRGAYLEVTAKSFYEGTDTTDYLHITLTDEEDILDGLLKLRTIYPNLMRLEYDNRRTRENQAVEAAQAVEEKSELELFEEFFQIQNNQPVSGRQREFVKKLIGELLEEEAN